jgi:septal ring factor EnvC (AmiA/AmiB activator)
LQTGAGESYFFSRIKEIQVQIELLWIIPIVAFASFIFIVAFVSQKKTDGQDLSKEVARFNNGLTQNDTKPSVPDQRLGELEKAISSVNESIASQQAVMERFQKENSAYSNEINELKSKLRDLYKEYDIVVSENYSLRARVKKLMEGREGDASETEPAPVSASQPKKAEPAKPNMKLYEDTRLVNLTSLDDTSEIDLSELK